MTADPRPADERPGGDEVDPQADAEYATTTGAMTAAKAWALQPKDIA